MGISLMTHVPDDLIFRKMEHQMHGHGKFHHAQIGRKMPAGLADLLDQEFPDLQSQFLQFFQVQFLNIIFLLYTL